MIWFHRNPGLLAFSEKGMAATLQALKRTVPCQYEFVVGSRRTTGVLNRLAPRRCNDRAGIRG